MPKFLKVDLAAKKGELFFFDFSRRDGKNKMSGKCSKINLEKTEKSAFYVRRIQKESMAFAKGIRNGDRVVKLNNFLIQGMVFQVDFQR